jgi:hypothetical protein
VVDHQVRERWLANARAGGSQLWVHAPTKDRADRLVVLLADYQYLSLHYFGEDGVEAVEGNVGSTSTGQRDDRHDRDDHSDQRSGLICGFGPLARLEPATCCLQDSSGSSTGWC